MKNLFYDKTSRLPWCLDSRHAAKICRTHIPLWVFNSEETYISFRVLNYAKGCRSTAKCLFEIYIVCYTQKWQFSKGFKNYPYWVIYTYKSIPFFQSPLTISVKLLFFKDVNPSKTVIQVYDYNPLIILGSVTSLGKAPWHPSGWLVNLYVWRLVGRELHFHAPIG